MALWLFGPKPGVPSCTQTGPKSIKCFVSSESGPSELVASVWERGEGLPGVPVRSGGDVGVSVKKELLMPRTVESSYSSYSGLRLLFLKSYYVGKVAGLALAMLAQDNIGVVVELWRRLAVLTKVGLSVTRGGNDFVESLCVPAASRTGNRR